MKSANFQNVYDIPDEYPWVAFNREGVLCGFRNAPVRDYDLGAWVDSTDGSYGDMLPFQGWETSCRQIKTLIDIRKTCVGVLKSAEQLEAAKGNRNKMDGRKFYAMKKKGL